MCPFPFWRIMSQQIQPLLNNTVAGRWVVVLQILTNTNPMEIFRKSEISHLAQSLLHFKQSTECLESKSIVYFVGITGSGKSLLINHMLGHPLKVMSVSGIKQIVLKQPQGPNKALIGTKLATSCTLTPRLYHLTQHQDIMICDTSGYNDQGPLTQTCELLNELYLTRSHDIASIILVININDIRSQRGGGFSSVFEQLDRISNFSEIKKKMQFIINYKNVYGEEVEDLFEQFKAIEKETYDNNSKNQNRIESRGKFFQAIFDKDSWEEEPNLEKFRNKVMIATKEELLEGDSELRKIFFQRVKEAMGRQKMHLNPSRARVLLTKHLVRGILSKQSSFQKCLSKYELYLKSQLIRINFWNPLDLQPEDFFVKARSLSGILLSTDIDDKQTQRLIYELNAQISEFQFLGRKHFVAYSFQQNPVVLSKTTIIPITVNLHFEIKNIIKEVQGFSLLSQFLDLKKGKYQAKFKSIESIPSKSLKIKIIASYQDQDKEMIEYLKREKMKFQKKLSSKNLLETLPLQEELNIILEIVKQTKDHKYFIEFVEKYSVTDEEMFRQLPSRDEVSLYYDQLVIYEAIMENVKVSKECIDLVFLERLKQVPFLSFQKNCKGFCSLNFHKIQNLVRLECGHEYEEYCFERKYVNDKSESQQKMEGEGEREKGEEEFVCVVCKKRARRVRVEKKERQEYSEAFKELFRIRAPEH